MGIPQFLPQASSAAGRPLDLKNFRLHRRGRSSHNNNGGVEGSSATTRHGWRKRLRVGVDVSTWIYRACLGFSDMLGDERHLSNLGRADLQHEQLQQQQEQERDNDDDSLPSCQQDENIDLPVKVQEYICACTEQVLGRLKRLQRQVDILVVLDGATPPLKQPTSDARSKARREYLEQRDNPNVDLTGQDNAQRLKAFARAGAGRYYSVVIANLLHACRHSCIPFMVAPYEADAQLGYLSAMGWIDLVVTEDSDLMACAASHVLYKLNDEQAGILLRRRDLFATKQFLDFSDAMLAVVFVCCGGDYCEKLRGIGLITAIQIVQRAFFECDASRENVSSGSNNPLAVVLRELFQATYDKNELTKDFKKSFERKFLSALLMYRHPVVFDPMQAICVVVRANQLDPKLALHPLYVDLFRNHLHEVVGDQIPSPLAVYVAEGWISPRTNRPYPYDGSVEQPQMVQKYLLDTSSGDGSSLKQSTETHQATGKRKRQDVIADVESLEEIVDDLYPSAQQQSNRIDRNSRASVDHDTQVSELVEDDDPPTFETQPLF